MVNKKYSIVAIALSFSLVLLSLTTAAQSNDYDMEALFSSSEKKEHRSYSLQYYNKNSSYYWIEQDSLYTCSGFNGLKIALTDIDLSAKKITKDKMLVENTTDHVYVLALKSLPGKTMYSYSCFVGKITGTAKPVYNVEMNLDMANNEMAEQAFIYLQKLSKAGVKTTKTKPKVPKTTPSILKSGNEKKNEIKQPALKEEPDWDAKELWDVCVDVKKNLEKYDDPAVKAWTKFKIQHSREHIEKVKEQANFAIIAYNRLSLRIINLLISPTENKLLEPLKDLIKARVIHLSALQSFAYYYITDGKDQKKIKDFLDDIRVKQETSNQKVKLANEEIEHYKLRNGIVLTGNGVWVIVNKTGSFEEQLAALINGVKDNYKSLITGQVKPGEFNCRVQLRDAVSTTINTGTLGSNFLTADFGNYNSIDEALPVFEAVTGKIESSKQLPVELARQEEVISSVSRSRSWLPLNVNKNPAPSLNTVSLVLELVKAARFDKDYNKKNIYFVVLKISR
jgi:hypothetical protein